MANPPLQTPESVKTLVIAAFIGVLLASVTIGAQAPGWYALARDINSADAAKVLGPYPSREFCRLAAKELMPDAQMFWTDAELADWRKRRILSAQVESRRRAEVIILAMAQKDYKPGKDIDIPNLDGCSSSRIRINQHGVEEFVWAVSGCGHMNTRPLYSVVSGCERVE